ncbi:glycerol-3-phosphate 1-O-acyltransferase PlsY [Bartonella ancashensis]|uniref:Glycerol-3-phosphate acyltransferase n=1 Tax=Bartonella ancashensis TaxID=1318743 RepID=A0A0M4L798_9HYPH|nr:glycerol-3-phosphate 1-O-acyltransferase PlsY [Bartonella ancashensis]ALE03758.1 Acyl-phosphate:glycerol-3-phosphate O-acyltransferase PlsY [Bartonella ancashensis]
MNELVIFLQSCTNAWLYLVISYLVGSIPFGLLFTKLCGLGDIRTVGSGNIGATNVLRTGNKKVAALTLLCDVLKGSCIVWGAKFLFPQTENSFIITLAGFLTFLGHLFPIWLKFKGGKGVATYLGVCMGFYWPIMIVFIASWTITFLLTYISSLSALITVLVVSIFVNFFSPFSYDDCIIVVMSVLVVIKHRDNITRILANKERKVSIK